MDTSAAIPVPEADARRWAESAYAARISFRMLWDVAQPTETSNFSRVGDLPDSIASRTKAYLLAAVEHLHMWADFATPLKFHEEQQTRIDLRPAYTLARAAMEASAHALWIFGTNDIEECIRRHLSLLRWDLQEHRKSKVDDLEAKKVIRAQEDALVAAVAGIFDDRQIAPLDGYLNLFREVCKSNEYDLDVSEVESLWRAASGAAHGKHWVGQDLTRTVPHAGHPGANLTVPDTAGMIRVLEVASYMVSSGVGKFVMWSGHDPIVMHREASKWVAANMTIRDGADMEVVERMRRGEIVVPQE